MRDEKPEELGRPPWEPSDKERGQVQAWADAGYTQEDIASRIGVDAKTLRKHCRQELDFGTMDLITEAVRQLGRKAIGAPAQFDEHGNQVRAEVTPELGAICFLLKTKGKKLGWSERLEVTGKDGGALLPDLEALMAKMTDEQLELIDRVQKLIAGLAAEDSGSAGNSPTTH